MGTHDSLKDGAATTTIELQGRDAYSAEAVGGTIYDSADMSRMGKKQVLKRNFRFISIVGFMTILQSTWESTLLANAFGLYNGGTAGIVWLTIAVCFCIFCMIVYLN